MPLHLFRNISIFLVICHDLVLNAFERSRNILTGVFMLSISILTLMNIGVTQHTVLRCHARSLPCPDLNGPTTTINRETRKMKCAQKRKVAIGPWCI